MLRILIIFHIEYKILGISPPHSPYVQLRKLAVLRKNFGKFEKGEKEGNMKKSFSELAEFIFNFRSHCDLDYKSDSSEIRDGDLDLKNQPRL